MRQENAETAHRATEEARADNLLSEGENALNGAKMGHVIGIDMANKEDCTGTVTAVALSEDSERTMRRIQHIQEATGMDQGEIAGIVQKLATERAISGEMAAAQLEKAIEAGETLKKAFRELAERLTEALMPVIKNLAEIMSKLGKTPAKIRKEELWKRYYEEKAKMTNNERRRRGIPMVKRPKKQQYVTNRRRKRR